MKKIQTTLILCMQSNLVFLTFTLGVPLRTQWMAFLAISFENQEKIVKCRAITLNFETKLLLNSWNFCAKKWFSWKMASGFDWKPNGKFFVGILESLEREILKTVKLLRNLSWFWKSTAPKIRWRTDTEILSKSNELLRNFSRFLGSY